MTDAGIKIIEELYDEWSANLAAPTVDGEDVIMIDEDEPSPEKQLEELRNVFAKYQPQIEKNEWIKSILDTL